MGIYWLLVADRIDFNFGVTDFKGRFPDLLSAQKQGAAFAQDIFRTIGVSPKTQVVRVENNCPYQTWEYAVEENHWDEISPEELRRMAGIDTIPEVGNTVRITNPHKADGEDGTIIEYDSSKGFPYLIETRHRGKSWCKASEFEILSGKS